MARLSREESQQQTRARILATAREAFLRDGYMRTSLDGIADAAGYSKGAVYSNFAGKDALFLELLQAKLDGDIAELGKRLAPAAPTEDTLDAIEQYLSAHGDILDFTGVAVEFISQLTPDSPIAAKCTQMYRKQRELLAGLTISVFAGAGREAPQPAKEIGAALVSMTLGLAVQRRMDKSAITARLWSRIVRGYLTALLAASSPVD